MLPFSDLASAMLVCKSWSKVSLVITLIMICTIFTILTRMMIILTQVGGVPALWAKCPLHLRGSKLTIFSPINRLFKA